MKGIINLNSIHFVDSVFSSWEERQGVVLLRSDDDVERIHLVDAAQPIVTPDLVFGWFSPQYSSQLRDQDIALITFTSGTEGNPKGVLLSRESLDDVVSRLNEAMGVDCSISEYVGVPVNYSFGFGRCRAIAAVGGKCFVPEHGFNPSEIQCFLARGEINAVSAVPSLWRILIKHSDIFGDERLRLKWIEIGSQYMNSDEKLALKGLFPNAAIVQHYGLTEASRSTFLRVDQEPEEYLESVGKAYGKTRIAISENGRICIKGPHVARQIIKDGIFEDNINRDGYLETTDLGELRQGFLFYKGRADDVINCGGIKLSPDVIEAEICQSLEIGPVVAVSKIPNELTGEGVLVSVLDSEKLEKDTILQQTYESLTKFGIQNRSVIRVQFVDEFPRTPTGKIQRKRLEQYFDVHHHCKAEPYEVINPLGDHELTLSEAKVLATWQEVLQSHKIDLDTDFYSLGGDSLTAIGAIISMEQQGVPASIAKGMLQGLTIRQIAGRMDNVSQTTEFHAFSTPVASGALAINVIRGILVCFVVFAHWWEGLFQRLSASFSDIVPFMGPIISAGTPGFAVAYGVSVGYALMPIFRKDPERLKNVIRKTVILLGVGVVTLAVFRFGAKLALGKVETFTHFTNSFYSVLTYYFLASVTIYFWIKLISKTKHFVINAMFCSILMYGLFLYVFQPLNEFYAEGIIELIKISLGAKYSYFNLMAGSLLGIAIGSMLRNIRSEENNLQLAFLIGAGLIMAALALGFQFQENWMQSSLETVYLHRWFMYAGVITVLFSLFVCILKLSEISFSVRQIIRGLAATGMLAFPIFVLHELVIPLKIMIDEPLGLSIGLPVALTLFIFAALYLYKKVYRVSFS